MFYPDAIFQSLRTRKTYHVDSNFVSWMIQRIELKPPYFRHSVLFTKEKLSSPTLPRQYHAAAHVTFKLRNKNKQTLGGGGVGEVLFFGEYLIKLQLPNKFYANSRQKQNCFSQGDFLLKHCFLKSVF